MSGVVDRSGACLANETYSYLQVFFNLSLILVCLYLLVLFIITVQRDVEHRISEYSMGTPLVKFTILEVQTDDITRRHRTRHCSVCDALQSESLRIESYPRYDASMRTVADVYGPRPVESRSGEGRGGDDRGGSERFRGADQLEDISAFLFIFSLCSRIMTKVISSSRYRLWRS